MAKRRVGVVGCGDVAQSTYLPQLKRLADEGRIVLAAVADPIAERARDAASTYGFVRAHHDHHAVLADEVDLVVNLTPAAFHARIAMDAISAGKHVYSEKPIAASMADADAIVDMAKDADTVVAAAPAQLTHPDVRQAVDWIRSGLVGKVCFVRARASNPGPDRITDFKTDPRWFYEAEGGGPLADLALYPLQTITAIVGPVKRVSCFAGTALPDRTAGFGNVVGSRIDVAIHDNAHLLLDFGEARFAIIDATYCVLSSKGPRMEVYGETGVINFAATGDEPPLEVFRVTERPDVRGWLVPEPVYRGRVNPPKPPPTVVPYSLVNGVEHVLRVIDGREPLLLTAEHGRHLLEVILGAEESARTGCAVELSTGFSPRLPA